MRGDLLRVLALAGAYFVAGKLGLRLAFVNPSATAVWPPAGIAVAAILLMGRRAWPGVALGAFLVNVTTAGSAWTSLAIAAGNTLEALLGATLVVRHARGAEAFARPQDVLRFAALAGLVATATAATIGATVLVLGGLAEPGQWPSVWLTWWLGDTGGVLIVAPVIVLLARGPGAFASPRRWTEATLLAMAVTAVGLLVFGPASPFARAHYPVEFLGFPVLVWAAFRFGPTETSLATLVFSSVATWGTLRDVGPFAAAPPAVSLLLLQACLGVIAMVALVLAAAVQEQRREHEAVRAAEEELRLLERQTAEEKLRMGEAQLAEAQALAHVGSWNWDVSSDEVAWSDELFHIFGLEPQGRRIGYRDFLEAVHPDDRPLVDAAVVSAFESGEPFVFEHRAVRPDGTVRWLQARGQVVMEGGRPVRMFGTGQDVTDQRAAEKAKSDFVANAAHELRTPLTAICGVAEILGGYRSRLAPGQIDEYCAILQEQTDRARRLITSLLDLSRLEQGLMQVDLRPIPLRDAARRALGAAAPPPGTDVALDVAEGLSVLADSTLLERILVNLLTNAYRYGGAAVGIAAGPAGGGRVRLAVHDDGEGVPEALLPSLFTPFARGPGARAGDGVGLGLAIVRGLAEAQEGSVAYEPGRPRGARFVLELRSAT